MAAAWFETWFNSEYYHILYNDRDNSEALAFLNKLIQHLSPAAGSRILDVGCGRGRHSIALAEMGFDVTGFDISPESIEAAKEEEKDNLHFFVHDMRLPFYINYYDFVFNFFTSFGYFRTQREHDDAIRTIGQSLKLNGKIIIDYLNVESISKNSDEKETKEIEGLKFNITKWQDEYTIHKQIEVIKPGETASEIFTERVAKYKLEDFANMLWKQGIEIKEVLGDYGLSIYNPETSPRKIIIAEKTKLV